MLKKSLVFLFSLALLVAAYQSAFASDDAREPVVVGGQPADPGEYPYMVALGNKNGAGITQWCGASLIHEEWVLTAAHCLTGETASGLRVAINAHLLSNAVNDADMHDITQIIIHPNYNSNTENNDIALLKLATPSDAEQIVPVLASETDLLAPGTMATVTGWGDQFYGSGVGSDVLREVDVPLVSNATCNGPFVYDGDVTGNMICAGFEDGGKDTCQNDSGGPLVVRDGAGNWRQAGVVSWGFECARPDAYGVYARVSNYEEWIEQHVGEQLTPTAVSLSAIDSSLSISVLPFAATLMLASATLFIGLGFGRKNQTHA